MKVGVDTFGCDHGNSWIGIYIKSVINCLKDDESVEFEFFGLEDDKYNFNSDNNFGFCPVYIPEKSKSPFIWHVSSFNAFCKKQQYDAVIVPSALEFIPIYSSVPIIAIVNDVISDEYRGMSFIKRFVIKNGLKNATKVVVPSQFVKKDLKSLRIKQKKIVVIHNGIDHSLFFPRNEKADDFVEINPFSIPKPYFIYVSKMSSPLKRHCELVRAFTKFRNSSGFKHRLVFAGNEGAFSQKVQDEVAESPFATDIYMTGNFPHEDFPRLYADSDGCVFPAEDEGVGLPVLEAMATGVPVACSKSGALPEIAGENVIFFDSSNPDDIAEKLELLAKKEKINIKSELSWVKRFDWTKTAKELVEIIKEIATKN